MPTYTRTNQFKAVGEFLKAKREASGWSRKELISKAELSYPYYSELENGQRLPSENAMTIIATAYGHDPAEYIAVRTKAEKAAAKQTDEELKAQARAISVKVAQQEAAREAVKIDVTGLDHDQIARLRVVAEAMKHGVKVSIDL